MTVPPRRYSLRPTRVVAVLLLVVPILEVMALVGVGQLIGGWPTFFLLVAISILGAWLIRLEGSRAWAALVQALRSGRMPARELADGMLVLIGGTLLLTPGFLTDLVGFALVLPMTRPVARRLLETVITKRLIAQSPYLGGGIAGRRPPRDPGGDVVEGEIVDE
ncbi:FxsA family protein [Intrasporangium calvum]|uniref:FxsA family protein n=1 Tax=Intrasporangium calvum TaxID=53358 RepID=A0ABT5GBQ3_9MICO|nr:FxsA family protein [Intrasporangium calvum]MDC5695638.1 FxsA family protein [Intrasporangium calvum]